MTNFTYTTQQEADAKGTYKITWYKGDGEDKQELCSGFTTLSGTDEGVASALAFAATDIRKANPDLFVEDTPAEPMMMDFFEEETYVQH